jgi:hypothetical protein
VPRAAARLDPTSREKAAIVCSKILGAHDRYFVAAPRIPMAWYFNHYECSRCCTTWSDEWSCACNDRCPTCNAEIEPFDYDDLTYIVEPRAQGKFVVMFSPDTAESSPNYEAIEIFDTEAAAYAYIVDELASDGSRAILQS